MQSEKFMRTAKLVFQSFLHAFGVLVYVLGVAWFLFNGQSIIGEVNNFWGPALILLLFVLSATIVGLLVLARPVMWYLNSQKSEAVKFLVYEIVWLVAIMVIFLVALVLKF